MKKILLSTLLVGVSSLVTFGQIINQSASWPNASWTLTGTYDAASLISDPTTTSNFSYDDDNAGSGSTDSLIATSPIIDLSAAVPSEPFIALEYGYDYNYGDIFDLEYYDADAASWVTWEAIPDNSSSTVDYCNSISGTVTSVMLDISGFTSNQLSNFQYRFYYDASSVYGWGFCMSSPTLYSVGCVPPTGLAASNLTPSSADLSWTAALSGAAGYNIEWGTPGFTPGTSAELGSTTSTAENAQATGLTINTSYDYYVQTDCGGSTSTWAGPYSFYLGYCIPAPTSVDGIGITNLTVGTINNTTGDETGHYGDYTAQITDANQGVPLSIDITLETGFTYDLWVWIDWNDDFDFDDADEAQYLGLSSNANPTTFTGSITVPLTAALGNHLMRIGGADSGLGSTSPSYPCYTSSYATFEDYTINVTPPPPCLPVTNLTASGILNTSANLLWTAATGAAGYNIEWGTPSFTPGTGTELGSSTSTVENTQATSLTPNTSYEYYVQTDCGGSTSTWAGPFTFTTMCDPVAAPWIESFDVTTLPTCWTQSSSSGGPWVFNGAADFGNSQTIVDHTNGSTSTGYAWVDQSDADDGVILKTPLIDVSALTVAQLRFWVYSHNNNGSVTTFNEINVEAFDGTSWVSVDVISGELGDHWVQFVYDASAYVFNTNLVQFRFRAESGGDSFDYDNDMLLDDVRIMETPTCPEPTNFTLDNADASSVTLSWVDPASAGNFNLVYGPVGFDPTTSGTVYNTTSNPATIPGLTSNQFFDVYVYTICNPGVDSSFIIGPITFNTYNQGAYMDWDSDCPTNGFIDIAGLGTSFDLSDDGTVGINSLPFNFLYQGQLISSLTIGNNGGLLLGTTIGTPPITIYDITTEDPGFYPWVDDLDSETGDVWVAQVGTSPNSTLIIQWDNSNNYYNGSETITFQIQIDEATGEIFYVYDDPVFGGSESADDYAGNAQIGIAGPNQDYMISSDNQTYLQNNSCIHFYYTDCPKPTNYAVSYTTINEAGITWSAGLAGETDWTVIYGPEGFDPTTSGTTITTNSNAAIITGLDDITTYDVYIYADCNPGTLQSDGYMGSFSTLPNCADPTGVTVNTATDSLFSSWSFVENPGFSSTGFNIQYGWEGFGLYDGTESITNADNNMTDTTSNASLMAGGVYDVYVQSVCGVDTSNWVGPVTVIMPLDNDSTCLAEMLAVDGTIYTFNNGGATIQTNEASIAPPATGAMTSDGWDNSAMTFTTWYTFVAPPSGNVRFDNTENSFDGQLAIYEVSQCDNFASFTLLGANDDALNGTSAAPRFSVCGLTPGNTYYIVHDSWSTSTTGTFKMKLTELVVEAGTTSGIIDVCTGDTINLYDGITGNDAGGTWSETIPTTSFNDPYFPTAGLAYQVFDFEYMVIDGCAQDSVTQQVKIYGPAQAGNDGVIDVCKNEPFDLVSGLSGTVDLGGIWYDPSNQVVANTQMMAGNIPGQFNYDYVASNGICQNDTANIIVNVLASCDWLNVAELGMESMELYPNPTTGMIYITNSGSTDVFSYELTDLNGKVIAHESDAINGTETTEVSLAKLEPGIYLIKVANDNVEHTFRVIKQ